MKSFSFYLFTILTFLLISPDNVLGQDDVLEREKDLMEASSNADSLAIITDILHEVQYKNPPKAQEYFDLSNKMIRYAEDSMSVYSYYNIQVVKQNLLGRKDSCIIYAELARDLADRLGKEQEKNDCIFKIAVFYLETGRAENAIENLEMAETGYKKLEQSDKVVRVRGAMGHAFSNLGRYQESVEEFKKAITFYKKNDPENKQLNNCHLNIGVNYNHLGEHQKALDYLFKAKAGFEKDADKRGQEAVNSSIASLYRWQKNYEKSIEFNEKAINLASETNNYLGVFRGHYNIATVYEELEQNDMFLEHLKEADNLTEKINHPPYKLLISMRIGSVFEMTNQPDSADFYLKKSLDIANNLKMPKEKAEILMNLGVVEVGRKKYPLAIRYLEEAKELQKTYGELEMLKIIEKHLAIAYFNENDYKKAYLSLETNKALSDSTFNADNIRKTAEIEEQYKKEQEIQKIGIVHEAELDRQALIRNFLIGGALLLTLFLIFIYRNFREKKMLANQLEQLNYTKDHIFAVMGHDLRKPALAFRGITEKLRYLMEREDYKTMHELGAVLEKNAHSLNKLTDNLLNWALVQKNALSIKPQKIAIAPLAEEVVNLFGTIAKNKNIELKITTSPNLELFVDRESILVILRNLIDNAIKYTSSGGIVELVCSEESEGIVLKVKDTGEGIAEERLKNIFLLQKGKSTYGTQGEKGTGLGLHLVQELVELNHGIIEVMSQLKRGTSVSIVLPSPK